MTQLGLTSAEMAKVIIMQICVVSVGVGTIIVGLAWNEALRAYLDKEHPKCSYADSDEGCDFKEKWEWRRDVAIATTLGLFVISIAVFIYAHMFEVTGWSVLNVHVKRNSDTSK